MSDQHAPVQSYQRIFRPDRRIYQIDGRPVPVPGGIPLAWLGWAAATLLAVLVISGRSWIVAATISLAVAAATFRTAGPLGAGAAAVTVAVGCQLLGLGLGVLDWPLRLLAIPGLVATVATQATPDGRPGHRYLLSLLALQVRPVRRSLERPLPQLDQPVAIERSLWVAADEHCSRIGRGRVRGPAQVRFTQPLLVAPIRQGVMRAVVPCPSLPRRLEHAPLLDVVQVGDGERLELVP